MANQTDKNVASALKLALILALSCPVWAGDIVIDKFGGLNTQDSSVTLADGEAQDLLNVTLTPGGKSVKKRGGYGLHKTLSVSTSAVHGAHYFQDLNGSDVQLWGNDGLLNATVSGGSPVQIATGTMSSTWQCADSVGYAYCLTSNRNMAVRTSGTPAITTYQPGIPLGTMLTFTPDRLVVAGVSGNESTLYFSQSNTFTSFTTGVLDASPFTEVISAPGSRITHVKYACGKLLWWKDNSFGYSVGSTQYDLENVTISQNIGTLDNSSDEYNGHVYFRGQDSHIYDYDCSNVTRLSRSITPTVSGANRRRANSWTVSSQIDLSAGYTSSTTVSNGSVRISTNNSNVVSNFSIESQASAGSAYAVDWTTSVASGFLNLYRSGNNTFYGCTYLPFDGSWNINSAGGYIPNPSWTVSIVDLSSNTLLSVTPTQDYSCVWSTYTIDTSTITNRYVKIRIRVVGTGQDSSLYSSQFIVLNNISFRAISSHFSDLTDSAMSIDYFTGGTSSLFSGTYYSTVNSAPALTSWNLFTSDKQDNDGTISFFTRASTGSFTIASSTPAWVAQTLGGAVNASTGTYFQMKASFTITAATQTPTMEDFSFNWFEGSAADKSYIKFWDDYVWIAVSSGTSGLNNRIFRWDTNNEAWLIDDIASNGFLVDNNRLYFGSPSAGKVYVYDKTLKTDDSGNINSFWKSKDFLGSDPFLQKNFDKADFIVNSASGTTLSVTYSLDTTSSTVISLNLYDPVHPGASIIRKGNNLPGNLGYFMNVKFGDNSSNSPWEVMGAKFGYGTQPWRPK